MQQPVEVEVEEDERIVERVAAVDVAKASGMVCTRVGHEAVVGKRVTKVWQVKATTRALVELADHLRCQGIQRVVLESTSEYWRPFYYLLEAAGLVVWLVNAAQAKNVPGRPKTDKIDAVWLAKLAERSMVSPSLVPTEPMRHVRDLARARFDLVEDRTRVKQRIEKLLEDALIKISSVLTDIHGVSGRAMIEALIAGKRSPTTLAELAKGRARTRRSELAEALEGRFTDHHARLARMLLDQLDDLTARITEVTALLDAAIAALPPGASPTDPAERTDAHDVAEVDSTPRPGPTPLSYASAIGRLCAIPGAGPDSIRAVIGEIGLDMTVFGRHQRLCSWAKVSPRTMQSGRKKGRAKTGKGNPYLKAALAQMATGAAKTDTFLGQRYRRLVKRMPKAKALVALQRSILIIIFHLLADPTAEFTDLGPDFYTRRINLARRTDQLTRQLQALGYHVQLTPANAA
ncbi:MAG TPA: IS110 family transposase [Pseudonocardiaceae bacterium]|jgi:transposase|nr:IS110 family transposase [Pseudonocardiaceae bacterium]